MAHLDFLLTKSIGEDCDENASSVLRVVAESPGAMEELLKLLRQSIYCRDIAPLLLSGLSEMYVAGHSRQETLEEVFQLLPAVCRPIELHTFALEAWVELWRQTCDCAGVNSKCRLSRARSLIALMIVSILKITEKGPLRRNRENYLLSISGQLLSKFFIPEAERPVHDISKHWIECVTSICDILSSISEEEGSETTTQANAEIALRMLSALLASELVHAGDIFQNGISGEALTYVAPSPALLNTLCSKLTLLKPSNQTETFQGPRSADFEIENSDIASFVLASRLLPDIAPRIVPMLWSFPKQADVEIEAARCLLRSRFPALGARLSVALFEDLRVAEASESLCSQWLEELILMVTSSGDETVMSLDARRNVFACMQKAQMSWDTEKVCNICIAIIGRCKSDSTVGIFVKLLKDVWTKDRLPVDLFHRTVKLTCSAEYQVLDGIDTLKSVLNWARLLYLRSPSSLSESDSAFGNFVKEIISKLNFELKSLETESDPESEMKKTRLVFIGHLASRVSEILENEN